MQKDVFHHYKARERKLVSVCFWESKWKLEIDDPKPPKKRIVSSHSEEEETPVEFVSILDTVQEHYHQIFISAKILQWNSSGNGNTAFKSVARRKFCSWTLAISSVFSSDLDKFKLETQIKTLKNVADETQVGIKETIKIISSLNASRKLLASEVLELVELILLVLTTNVASERSCSTLCGVKTYLRSSITQEPVTSCLIVTTYKKQVDKRKLVEAASQFCVKNEHCFSIKE